MFKWFSSITQAAGVHNAKSDEGISAAKIDKKCGVSGK